MLRTETTSTEKKTSWSNVWEIYEAEKEKKSTAERSFKSKFTPSLLKETYDASVEKSLKKIAGALATLNDDNATEEDKTAANREIFNAVDKLKKAAKKVWVPENLQEDFAFHVIQLAIEGKVEKYDPNDKSGITLISKLTTSEQILENIIVSVKKLALPTYMSMTTTEQRSQYWKDNISGTKDNISGTIDKFKEAAATSIQKIFRGFQVRNETEDPDNGNLYRIDSTKEPTAAPTLGKEENAGKEEVEVIPDIYRSIYKFTTRNIEHLVQFNQARGNLLKSHGKNEEEKTEALIKFVSAYKNAGGKELTYDKANEQFKVNDKEVTAKDLFNGLNKEATRERKRSLPYLR